MGGSILNQREIVDGNVGLNSIFGSKRSGIMREPDFGPKPELKKRAEIPADPLEAAMRLQEKAKDYEIDPKLLGGLAFKILCRSAREGSLARNRNDIDLAVKRKDVAKLKKVMSELGYEYPIRDNVLSPDQILYLDNQNQRQVDIFVDGFQMCHKFDFREGLESKGATLPITDLIMTKLQIAEITYKDLQDLASAFSDFRLGQEEGNIRYDQIASLASKNWGIWKDFTDNLRKLKAHVKELAPEKADEIAERVGTLLEDIEKHPKSARWSARARFGERLKWHELPQRR
ncbi:MAG: hypothetical protein KGI04_01610 [Candidatus Micrarchaeota archaeon]|nr:hypothetical protein [Candidatus Micrarchaeota archaeon]